MPVPDRRASPRMMPNSSLESAWFDVLRGSYRVSNSDDLSERANKFWYFRPKTCFSEPFSETRLNCAAQHRSVRARRLKAI
jgi:hypothetical protein